MPEPLLYVKAMAAAAGASAVVLLVAVWGRRFVGTVPAHVSTVLALGIGQAVGYCMLRGGVRWPPVNGLDRYFTIVLPAIVVVELVAGIERVPRWLAWALRLCLAASVTRVLLHGSVYLGGPASEWAIWQTAMLLTFGAAVLAALWASLAWPAKRSPGASLPLALALSIYGAGVAIMLAGYIAGGAACFPVAAALVVVIVAACCRNDLLDPQAAVAMGTVGLFSLVLVGRFFGALTTGTALVLLAAPLCCWVTELPLVRRQKPWIVVTIRLALVSIVLIAVLIVAKLEFNRTMGPLLMVNCG